MAFGLVIDSLIEFTLVEVRLLSGDGGSDSGGVRGHHGGAGVGRIASK